jgi:hypothetical protein
MIIDVNNPPAPKYWESTPSIKTDLIQMGRGKLVKATLIVGRMTVTAYSDLVQEPTIDSIQNCTQQATQRAMKQVPRRSS